MGSTGASPLPPSYSSGLRPLVDHRARRLMRSVGSVAQ